MGQRDELCGRTVGEFVLRERIGEGGFGAVYRCEQPLLGREAVVKVLHRRLRDREVVVQRFLREAQLASRLDHPYAAHIYAFGVDQADGMFWIAMEMVHGTTLDHWLRDRGRMPLADVVPFFERVAEVVQTAHEAGVVHRDLKPSNIMVIERAGRLLPKLLDFGIAKLVDETQARPAINGTYRAPVDDAHAHTLESKPASQVATLTAAAGVDAPPPPIAIAALAPLTQADATMGSPPYMAPEQWMDATTVGPRADLYALGVVAYEMLAGRRPFIAPTVAAFADMHLNAPVPPLELGLPPAVDELFTRALAKHPDDRPATALELAASLRVASGLGEQATDLPRLDDTVRDGWLADAPQPLAEAIAVLDGARNAHQAREAARDVFRGLVRYLVVVALASRAQVRGDRDPPALVELLRALRRRELDDDERIRLVRMLVRPFADRRGAHAIPELVDLVQPVDGRDAFDPLLDLRPTSEGAASEDVVRSQLARYLPELARLLRAASFVLDYALVVPSGGAAEKWTGLRRQRRPIAIVRGVADDRAVLVGRDSRLLLWPLVQAVAPTPGGEREMFVFDGRGRRGARLVASPAGFEHHDPVVWEWLADNVLGEVDPDAGSTGDERAPYLGLATFAAADADRFFGREREIEAFANRMRKQALQIVVGPSGAGKSSFVHAGVVPALPREWRAIAVRPGSAPIATLAARLAAAGVSATDLRPLLEASPAAAATLIAHAGSIVLVVDQLEELFTLCADAGERERFAAVIAALAASPDAPTRVICTVRDDFLMHVEALPALRAMLSPALFLLGNPSRDDLARCVSEPARRLGYEPSDGELVRDMVDAVADRPGALALLSFTASRLWELRDRQFRQLTRKAYDAMGGVGGALRGHADDTYGALAGDESRIAADIFRHLVTSELTRAVLGVDELRERLVTPRADAVIGKLVAARLLAVSDADGASRVEIIHEALIAAWPRLREWVREDVDGRRMHEQLRSAALQWDERKRPRGLLWSDEALADLERWRRRASPSQLELAFADASRNAARRGRRIRRGLVASAFAILAVCAGVLLMLNRRADDSAAEAHQRVLDLDIEQGRQALLAKDPMRSLVYLSAAFSGGARRADLAFMTARATEDLDAQERILPHTGPVRGVDFTPDGRTIATADDDGARVWDASTGAQLHFLPHAGRVWAVQFSRDGTQLATACQANTAEIWDVATGRRLRTLAHPKEVRFVRYSPDGRWIATASWDHDVRLWDAATGALVHTLHGHTDIPIDLAFRADSARLVSAAIDGTARLWDVATGEAIATLQHGDQVTAARFSPDGMLIATASSDRTAKLWDDHGREVRTLVHFASVASVEFDPSGKQLVTSSDDFRATIWDVATGQPRVTMIGHTDLMSGAMFSPDGTRVLTYSADGTARLWDADTGSALVTFVGHTEVIWLAAFSPDGTRVVTGGFDRSARVWRTTASRRLSEAALDATDDVPVALGGGRVWLASTDGHPSARDDRDGKLVARATGTGGRALWSPDGAHVLAIDASGVRLGSDPLPDTANAKLAMFSPDGARVALGFDDRTEVWRGTARERVLRGAAAPTALAFARDGRLAAAHGDGRVTIWDGDRALPLVGHARQVSGVAWSRDGRLVATAGSFEQSARVWDAATGRELALLQGHTGVIESVAFDPTGTLVATAGSSDATASVWSVDGSLLMSYPLAAGARWVGFSDDGTRLLALVRDDAGKAPRLSIWRVDVDARAPDAVADYVRCRVPFALDGERLVPATTRCP